MKSTFKLILYFSFLLIFEMSGQVFSLYRDLPRKDHNYYCAKHIYIPKGYEEIQKHLDLIPVIWRCEDIQCSKCDTVILHEVFNGYDEAFDYLCECMPCPWESRGERYPPHDKPKTWRYCAEGAIYGGYLNPYLKKYFRFLKGHLEYSKEYKECRCYWPELNCKAAVISNKAYELFIDLFTHTALSQIVNNPSEQTRLFHYQKGDWSPRKLTLISICHSFYFSSYYYVCKELSAYSQKRYEKTQYQEIDQKLRHILTTLSPLFLELYEDCLKTHPNEVIHNEKLFLEML